MADNIIEITEEQMLVNSAKITKADQSKAAHQLKKSQERCAIDLKEAQSHGDCADIGESQVAAAQALLHSQEQAAETLQKMQSGAADRLRKLEQRFSERIKNKNDIIDWMAGGYSIHGRDNENGG